MNKIIRAIKLPTTVRGITVTDPDGNYNIYINKDMSYEMQLETLIHESKHIENNDFCSLDQVSQIEEKIKYYMRRKRP